MDARSSDPAKPPSGSDRESARSQKHVREIAGFELIKLLGEGGMGRVFRARQKSLDRDVALKVLSPKLAGDREYLVRFEREALAAAKLQHKNIVQVIDRGRDPQTDLPYIAFEFVDGRTLEQLVVERGKLPEREALRIAAEMLEALGYASEKGLIHRDVKPDNILIAKDGTPKLADLGLAKAIHDEGSTLTQAGMVMGTPHYMAPEQATGERDIDVRADLYALGLVLWRMLAGKLPWPEGSPIDILSHHINEDCPDPRDVAPEVSEGAAKVCLGLAARELADRYQTPADALRDALNVLQGNEATGPTAQGSVPTTKLPAITMPRADPTSTKTATPSESAKKKGSARKSADSAKKSADPSRASSSRRARPDGAPSKTSRRRSRNVLFIGAIALAVAFATGGALAALVDRGPPPLSGPSAARAASAAAWRGRAREAAGQVAAAEDAKTIALLVAALEPVRPALWGDDDARAAALASLEQSSQALDARARSLSPPARDAAEMASLEARAWLAIARVSDRSLGETLERDGRAKELARELAGLERSAAVESIGGAKPFTDAVGAIARAVEAADAGEWDGATVPARKDVPELLHSRLLLEGEAAAAWASARSRGKTACEAFAALAPALRSTSFVRGRWSTFDASQAKDGPLGKWVIEHGALAPPVPVDRRDFQRYPKLELPLSPDLARGALTELKLDVEGAGGALLAAGDSLAVIWEAGGDAALFVRRDDEAVLAFDGRVGLEALKRARPKRGAERRATTFRFVVQLERGGPYLRALSGERETGDTASTLARASLAASREPHALSLRASGIVARRVEMAVSR